MFPFFDSLSIVGLLGDYFLALYTEQTVSKTVANIGLVGGSPTDYCHFAQFRWCMTFVCDMFFLRMKLIDDILIYESLKDSEADAGKADDRRVM